MRKYFCKGCTALIIKNAFIAKCKNKHSLTVEAVVGEDSPTTVYPTYPNKCKQPILPNKGE